MSQVQKHGRMSEAQAKSEFGAWMSKRTQILESGVDKWSRNPIGGVDLAKLYEKNKSKAYSVAAAVSNQERELHRLSEAQVSTAFGTALRPEHLLKAIYIGTAQAKRGEFATEFPLTSTDDVMMFIYMNRAATLRGGVANDRIYEVQAPYYPSEQQAPTTFGTGNNSTTQFSFGPLSPLPLVPLWTRILVDGAIAGTDNGSGVFINIPGTTTLNTASTNTVDYNAGTGTVTFATAPATGAVIAIMWNWSSENSANFSSLAEINIELRKERFNARPMPVGYNYSMMTQLMLDTDNIGNAREMLMRGVGDAHAMAMDERAIQYMRQIALTNSQATFNTDFAANGEISRKSWAQNILQAIGNVSAQITNEVERGQVNNIVGGPLAVNYLRLHELWTEDTSDMGLSGTRKIGSLAGINVFQTPSQAAGVIGNSELLLSYKNPVEGMDVGAVFANLTEISAELVYPQMYTQGYRAYVGDQKVITRNFVRLMQLTNLTQNIG
jgi:hypothetical protein